MQTPTNPLNPPPGLNLAEEIPMNPGFYIAFFCLAGEDRLAFEVLTEDDEMIEKSISDCAQMWREKIRKVFPDPLQCRQRFLIRAVLMSATRGMKTGYGPNVAAAFALFLCDRVERRVRTLDFEAEHTTGRLWS